MENKKNPDFDVIVVGAGHAGVEAALVSARRGQRTLLITTNMHRISYMSCNPAIGGLAKGHMVREVDAMGGEMGRATDESCIQFKRLNSARGPAVRGSRAQCDKELYSQHMTKTILGQEHLLTKEAEVKGLLLDRKKCLGVVLGDESQIHSRAVIITTGTFMNGVMHVGLETVPGGRVGDKPSVGLSDQLRAFGFTVQRLKTGTPARLHKDSIDWAKTIPQPGDEKFFPFSFKTKEGLKLPQVLCYLSHTNEKTHEVIRKNIHKSPMYCGIIEGVGPRYCPSIEDKVVRFAEKISHQTFLEPEGLSTDLIYLQGISTSLPADVQDEFLKTIPGLENVKVVRYGYAVEYDFIEPTQIRHTLETRSIENLFLAGQINGTSGYEEAAAQGFMAGLNASLKIQENEALVLRRDEGYIGVLIDDLITKGTQEPYRMFTSRAEHRLVLREDNALDRLFDYGLKYNLIAENEKNEVEELIKKRQETSKKLKETIIYPNQTTQSTILSLGSAPLLKPASLEVFLRRPEIQFTDLKRFDFEFSDDPSVYEPVEIEVKYAGYISRQKELIEQSQRLERLVLDEGFQYVNVRGLSAEEIEKLNKVKPRTLGQAARISGVNPSAIQALLIHLKGNSKRISEIAVDYGSKEGRHRTISVENPPVV